MILTGHAGGLHMAALEEACQMAVEERDFRSAWSLSSI